MSILFCFALFLFMPSFDYYIHCQAVGVYNDQFVHHDEVSHRLSQQGGMEKAVGLDNSIVQYKRGN